MTVSWPTGNRQDEQPVFAKTLRDRAQSPSCPYTWMLLRDYHIMACPRHAGVASCKKGGALDTPVENFP